MDAIVYEPILTRSRRKIAAHLREQAERPDFQVRVPALRTYVSLYISYDPRQPQYFDGEHEIRTALALAAAIVEAGDCPVMPEVLA